jgi:hypothetical protein
MVPTIHGNGTSKRSILEGYGKAFMAINKASDVLRETCPNGRDFYPQGSDALEKAILQHQARMEKLQSILDDLEELADRVSEQGE